MSTNANLLLSAMWWGLALLTPWAVLPAVACLAVAAVSSRLDDE